MSFKVTIEETNMAAFTTMKRYKGQYSDAISVM